MSIASEITRLQGAKADIKSAIEAKGVTVPSNALLDTFDTYIAQIASGSTGLEYESGTVYYEYDESRPTVRFSKSHTNPPSIVLFYSSVNGNLSSGKNIYMLYVDIWRMFGTGFYNNSSTLYYGAAHYVYKNNNVTTYGTKYLLYNSDNTGDSSADYPKYWVTNTLFRPYTNSTSRYWFSNATHKWIAIWT